MSSSGVSPDLYGPRPGVIAPLPLGERGVAIVTAASPNGQYFIYSNGTNVIVRDVEVCLIIFLPSFRLIFPIKDFKSTYPVHAES